MKSKQINQQKEDLYTHLLIFGIFSIGLLTIDFLLDRIIEWAWLPIIGWSIAILIHLVFYLRTK